MRILILIIGALTMFSSTYGQQDAMYTHYSFNTLVANPAYAGSRDATTVTLLHRSQWVGFDGAPQTQTLTLHSPVFHESLGLGLSVINDEIGPVKQTSFYGDISYRFYVSSATRLAFGLKGGGSLHQADLSRLKTEAVDSRFTNQSNKFLPNFGLGVYLFNPKWYVGVSAPKVIENGFSSDQGGFVEGERKHYFLIAGFISDVTSGIKFKPTAYLKATESAPIQGELTGMFIFNDKLELGLMYRSGDALGALIGYNFTTQLRVGYSYDWSLLNKTGVYNSGSHEIMLRYDFVNTNKSKIYSPRYF